MFVDADDILLEDAITNCLISAKAENADVVLFGMSNFPKSTRVKKMLSSDDKEKLLLATLSYLSAEYVKIGISIDGPCAKLFRASIIEEYDIFFPENIARAEDAIFDAYCYEYADKVFVDNCDVYTFISNPASLTRSYKYQLVQMIPIYLKEEKKFIETFHPNSLLYAKSLQYRTFMGVMEVVYSYFEPNPERKSVKRLRKEFTDLMRNEFVHDNLQGITKTDLQKMGFQSLTDFLYFKSFLKPSYLLFKLSLLLMRFLEAIFSTKVYRELRRV